MSTIVIELVCATIHAFVIRHRFIIFHRIFSISTVLGANFYNCSRIHGYPYLNSDSKILAIEGIISPLTISSKTITGATLRNDVINYFDKFKNYYSKLLREKYKHYIARYRSNIRNLVSLLRNEEYEMIGALRESVRTIVDVEISLSLEDLRKSLNDNKINTLIAPTSITRIIGLGASFILNPGWTLTASAVTIAAQAYRSKRKSDSILRNNDYAFLQLVSKKL